MSKESKYRTDAAAGKKVKPDDKETRNVITNVARQSATKSSSSQSSTD